MKFLEVSDSDIKLFAQLINMLHVAEIKVNGKDVCAAADSIRWLQNVAKAAAECYSQSKTPKVEAPVPSNSTKTSTCGTGRRTDMRKAIITIPYPDKEQGRLV